MKTSSIALFAMLGACAGPVRHAPGPLRFANREPVTLVNDRRPIAPPKTFDESIFEYYIHEDVMEPTRRALTVETPRRAANANSIGNVPDSAWFTNRKPTPEQVRRGPGGGGPDRSEPWRVIGVKVGGAAIGITIKDARGDRYVLKFDEREFPETETAADVIVQRLTWAFGYNVPDNEVVYFERPQLVLDPSAEVKLRTGAKRPMTQADLEKYVGMATPEADGRYRALASKFVPGKVVGGVDPGGVRDGDPNDRVPHELRRDLRGQRMLWAWVDHVDLKSQNSLATYTDGKYVEWYALDFGDSLGVTARTTAYPILGYRGVYSLTGFLTSLFTLGLRVEPWEKRISYPELRGLGHFESELFDPARWTPAHHWRPADAADRFDDLWAAEILMRMAPEHIEAGVAAGAYSDPRTSAYVVQILLERQRKIGHHAFSRVAPLTEVEATDRDGAIELCFTDLWLEYAYGSAATTAYRTRVFDDAGRPLAAASAWLPPREPRSCISRLPTGAAGDGYTIVEVEVRRGTKPMPPVFVHVARGRTGMRVIGLDRR